MASEQHFSAILERGDRALGWTIVRLPFDPHATWPMMVRLRVCGAISGPAGKLSFRTSLFPVSGKDSALPGFYVLINSAMQRAAGVTVGQAAAFELRPDLEDRPALLPEPLDALLDEAEGLRIWYNNLSEYTRRELGKRIVAAKSEPAQLRRAQQVAEQLLSTMEAEIAFPPLIEQAFRRRPRARAGWLRMSSQQRRSSLMAVFSYGTSSARERRLTRLLDDAERRAGTGEV